MSGLLLVALFLGGCSGQPAEATGYDPADPPNSHPASEIVKDDRAAFHIDPDKPWRIEFGRGSGWHGLETIKLDQTGRLVLHRQNSGGWETATFELPVDAVKKVLEAVAANRLLELHKAYHAAVADGTQWVLLVRQGGRQKAVYFNNHFPDSIVRFASRLDESSL